MVEVCRCWRARTCCHSHSHRSPFSFPSASSFSSFVDALLNGCLMLTLPSIMRGPKWAGAGLASLSLFGILLLGKVVAVILGAVWILGHDGLQCVRSTHNRTATRAQHENAQRRKDRESAANPAHSALTSPLMLLPVSSLSAASRPTSFPSSTIAPRHFSSV